MFEASIIEARLYSLKIQTLRLVLIFWTHTFPSAGGTSSLEMPVQSLWLGTEDSAVTARSVVPAGLLPGLRD